MSQVTGLRGEAVSPLPNLRRRDGATACAEGGELDRARSVTPQYRYFAPGSELIAQDEPHEDVFTLVEGWISIHHILEDGRRQILGFLLPGDICGFTPLSGGSAPHAAEALTGVTVSVLPRARFEAMLAADAGYAAAVVGRLFDTLSGAYESLVDMGRRSATEAVAHLLWRLDRRIRASGGAAPGTAVDFPPTQEQLGDALGLSAAHVCRSLRVLRERGILSLRRQELQIHDPAALCRMLGRDERRSRAGHAAPRVTATGRIPHQKIGS